MGLKNFTLPTAQNPQRDISGGSKGYGDWEFYLLVGKRDYLPSQRIEFNMNKASTKAGTSDANYSAKLNDLLNKLD